MRLQLVVLALVAAGAAARPTLDTLSQWFFGPAKYTSWRPAQRAAPPPNRNSLPHPFFRAAAPPSGAWRPRQPQGWQPYPGQGWTVDSVPAILVFEEHIPPLGPSASTPIPSEQPAPEQPSPEVPSPEQPSPEEPVPEQPSPEVPNPEQPSPEEPSPEQPSTEEPTPEEPVPEQPSPEEPVPEQQTTTTPSPTQAPTEQTPSGEVSPSASPDPSPPTTTPPSDQDTEDSSTQESVTEIDEYTTLRNLPPRYLPPGNEVQKRDVSELAEATTVQAVPLPAPIDPQGPEDNSIDTTPQVRTLARFVEELLELRSKVKGTLW